MEKEKNSQRRRCWDLNVKLWFRKIPQILENIKIKDDKILKNHSVKRSIKIAKKLIKNQGRILVRKSGTEPKIRIMGESENKILLKKCIKMISKEFK